MENKLLDTTGWKILQALQENGRISYAELAKQVNLTAPAVAERVRKMEEAGLITGYRAEVNLEKLGYRITAFILMGVPYNLERQFLAFVPAQPEILECHNITGRDSFLLKVAVCSTRKLDQLLERLVRFGQPTTLLVFSHNTLRRVIDSGCGGDFTPQSLP